MLKDKNFWLKAATVLALSFSAFPAYTASPEIPVKHTALGELVSSAQFKNLVELPDVPGAGLEAVLPETRAAAPAPGRDFTPTIEDASRIKFMMELISDIYNNRPLPYPQDGSIFKNKEGRLPAQQAGFYREYTLLTGNAPHTVVIGGITYQVAPDLTARGSERIVIGGGEKIYYTPDHYVRFIQLTVVN